ncbi:MAG: cadherin-like domain-containing protein, partial [Nitrospirota bacterium]
VSVTDGTFSDTAAITINLLNVNEAPVAGDDTATTPQNTVVTTGNVLGNDNDPESVLIAGNITAFDAVSANGGMVVNNGDGTFTYTPALNFTGMDTFTYTVSDGVLTDTATVTITVTPAGGNSAPTLMTNAGAIVLAGFSDPITSDQLQVTDADNTPAQLVYTVTTGPMNGRLELAAAPGVAVTSFTQADINAGLLWYVPIVPPSTGDSFTFTVSDGAGGTIGATTFNLTVMPFFPPPLGWPPAPGPAAVPFTDLPGPPSVGVLMPVLAPSSEVTWSPGRQNPDVVQAKIVDKHDEPAPREKMVSKTFTSVEHVEPEDIALQEPSDLPPDPLSPLVKKVLAVGHNFEERLTKEADILEQAIEERVIVTALSAGLMVWLLRRGSSLTSSFTSMLGRRKDDEQGNG